MCQDETPFCHQALHTCETKANFIHIKTDVVRIFVDMSLLSHFLGMGLDPRPLYGGSAMLKPPFLLINPSSTSRFTKS